MYLADIAADLLGAAETGLIDGGRTVPDRSFVSHGPPAWEACESDQLTVHLAPLSFRMSRNPRRGYESAPIALWHVQIVRCAPQSPITGPPSSALEASAGGLLDDLAALTRGVCAAPSDIFGGCTGLMFGQAIPLGPSGGVAGWDWTITADATDTDPPVS